MATIEPVEEMIPAQEIPRELRDVRRINVGCGFDRRAGYINVDLHAMHSPDVIADVRDLRIFATAGYDEVLAQDVLEHLPRADAQPALMEWARILAPGGKLVLRLPNLLGLLHLFRDRPGLDDQRVLVQLLFGTQAYQGDWHLNGYTELLLRHALHDAGFDVESINDRDGWMFDVVAVRTEHPAPVDSARLSVGTGTDAVPVLPIEAAMHDVVAGDDAGALLARARAAVDQARDLAAAPEDVLGRTRLRTLKRALLRFARLVTVRQVAHNRAVDEALDCLVAHAEQASRR
jgi:predicted SAM-dependent methyltransferase